MKPNNALQNKKLALSAQLVSSLDIACPSGKSYLNFQKVAVEYNELAPNFLNADPPGVGKTIQTIAFMNHKKIDSCLVFAPASLLINWKRELSAWHLNPELRVEIFNPKTFDPLNPPDVLLASYAYGSKLPAIKQILRWGKYRLTVLDECHYLRTSRSQRTKYILAKNGIISRSEFNIALSGTPLVNKPMELYPIIKALCPEAIGQMTRHDFGMEFCEGWLAPWGWDYKGASNLKLLGQMLRSHFMLRRPKKDLLPLLPKRFPPNIVYIDAKTGDQSYSHLSLDSISKRVGSPDFIEIARVRHEIGVAKIKASALYIANQLESGHEKIVVFAHHKKVIEELKVLLEGFGAVSITGETNAIARDNAVQSFQNDPQKRVIILSIEAASIGLTLTAASYVIFVESSWVPGVNEQAINRVERIGQTRGVQVDYLTTPKSLDERILKALLTKQESFDEVFQS